MFGVGAFAGEGHAGGNGQGVAERAGAEFYAGNSFVRNVAGKIGAVLAVIEKAFDGEKAAFSEGGVDGGPGVAFGKEKAVAGGGFGILGIDVEDGAVEDGDDVGHREGSADMGGTATIGHAQDVKANAAGESAEFGEIGLIHSGHFV